MWLCGYVAMWLSSKISRSKKIQKVQYTHGLFFEFVGSQISKDNISQDVPIFFVLIEAFW